MLTKLSIHTISFYQRYISPHKGFCCAYSAYTGEESCSQYAKMAIASYGVYAALPHIKQRFNACSYAAEQIKKNREVKKNKNESSATECLTDIACQSTDCIPSSCFGRGSKHGSCHIDSCDVADGCSPFN